MVLPTRNPRNPIPYPKIIVSILLILFAGFILTNYYQLHSIPFSFISTNTPCQQSYNNASHHENQPIVRLGTTKTFNLTYVEENLHTLEQTDPQLIQYTRIRHLTPPSKQPYPDSMGDVKGFDEYGFAKLIAKLFDNKRNGLFIEAGANDGGKTSHTFPLEKMLGWTGLLVECNPLLVPYLRTKHRKAWIADVCLSPTGHAETFNFSNPTGWSYSGTLGKPTDLERLGVKWNSIDVQAIPLYTILAGLGWNEVDFFCFDVEGQELAILKSFPFHLFKFKVLIFEVYQESSNTKEKRLELDALLKKNGYVFYKELQYDKVFIEGEFYKELVAMKKV